MSYDPHNYNRRTHEAHFTGKRTGESLGVSRSTLYRMMDDEGLPRPIKITGRAVGWRVEDVQRWIAERPFDEATKKGD